MRRDYSGALYLSMEVSRRLMPDKIDLGDGDYAEIRTELTGGDQKWYLILRGKLMRENGTAKPAYTEPDPANTARMREVPAVAAELTAEDNIALLDAVLGRLLVSWSLPQGLPWTSGMRDETDLDIMNALDDASLAASRRLMGIGPKLRSFLTSASTSSTTAPAPRTEPTPEP
jgi:hypothetical protein